MKMNMKYTKRKKMIELNQEIYNEMVKDFTILLKKYQKITSPQGFFNAFALLTFQLGYQFTSKRDLRNQISMLTESAITCMESMEEGEDSIEVRLDD